MSACVSKERTSWPKALCLAALFFSLCPSALFAQAPAKTVPAFNFKTANGTDFSNKNLASGKLLFFIFFDTECDHCRRAMAYVEKNYASFKTTALYLITLDNEEKLKPFFNQYASTLRGKNNVTLLHDTRNEFIAGFGPKKYPSLFLYSAGKNLILYDDEEKSLPEFAERVKRKAK